MRTEKETKSSMESNPNEEMYEKDTRELLIAVGIGILLGILAYEVTLFVNLRISCLLMPGLAALCVGGAGLFVVGWFSFLGYEFYLGNKKTEADKFSFENLDIYGKILWATTAVGLSMIVSTAFAPLFLIRK
jgi:hypothetical protein